MILNPSPAPTVEIERLRTLGFPESVIQFYESNDGARFGRSSDDDDLAYRIILISSKDIIPVTEDGYIFPDDPYYNAAKNWFKIVDYFDGNCLALDINDGSIRDCFHETLGSEGADVIHNSFSELIAKLGEESGVYWL